MSILEAENIYFGYKESSAILKDVSFSVNESEFLGITGPNGSGKTTLLKISAGLLAPVSGTILLNGADIAGLDRKAIAQSISFVPSAMSVPAGFTALDIVLMGRFPKKLHSPRLFPVSLGKTRKAENELDLEIAQDSLILAGAQNLSYRTADTLSAGEQQKIFLAQALAQEPKILILDEPDSHLDTASKNAVYELLAGLAETKKLSVIIATHHKELASKYCKRTIYLEQYDYSK